MLFPESVCWNVFNDNPSGWGWTGKNGAYTSALDEMICRITSRTDCHIEVQLPNEEEGASTLLPVALAILTMTSLLTA